MFHFDKHKSRTLDVLAAEVDSLAAENAALQAENEELRKQVQDWIGMWQRGESARNEMQIGFIGVLAAQGARGDDNA